MDEYDANITKLQVLKTVLQHSQSRNTSFHIENIPSRMNIQNKEDKKALQAYLDYWVEEGLVIQRKHGVYSVPNKKWDEVKQRITKDDYPDLTLK